LIAKKWGRKNKIIEKNILKKTKFETKLGCVCKNQIVKLPLRNNSLKLSELGRVSVSCCYLKNPKVE